MGAKDLATGKDQRITITASSGINKDEIDRMVKDAAAHEAEDKKRREEIDRRNKLDNMCYQLEKQIADNKDKLAGVDVASIESLIKDGRAAVEKQDDDKVAEVLEKLEKEAHAMATKMYEGAGGPPGGAGPGGPSASGGGASEDPKKGDVIDAEFEETN